jgi:hypothetical protein
VLVQQYEVGGSQRAGPVTADERGCGAELRQFPPQGLGVVGAGVWLRGRQIARMMTPGPRAVVILAELVQDLPAQGPGTVLRAPDGQDRQGLVAVGEPPRTRPLPRRAGKRAQQREPGQQLRMTAVKCERGAPAEAAADDEPRAGRERPDRLGYRRGKPAGLVAPVAPPVGAPVAGQVDRDRCAADGDCHGIPGAGALTEVMQEHDVRLRITPEHAADVAASGNVDPSPPDPRQGTAAGASLLRRLRDKRELIPEFRELL